jgi:hypothetical protein
MQGWHEGRTLPRKNCRQQSTGRDGSPSFRETATASARGSIQVTNQLFFVEEIERAVAFGVDGVSEIAFNGWKYRNHDAAFMVVGCIVDLLANRKFRHRELLFAASFKTAVTANPDGGSMSRPPWEGL